MRRGATATCTRGADSADTSVHRFVGAAAGESPAGRRGVLTQRIGLQPYVCVGRAHGGASGNGRVLDHARYATSLWALFQTAWRQAAGASAGRSRGDARGRR